MRFRLCVVLGGWLISEWERGEFVKVVGLLSNREEPSAPFRPELPSMSSREGSIADSFSNPDGRGWLASMHCNRSLADISAGSAV